MDFTFYDQINDRMMQLSGVYKNKKDVFDKLDQEVNNLSEENKLLTKTEKVLKHLVDKLVKKDLAKMDQLVTYGLKTVYPEKNLEFKSTVDEHRGKLRILLKTLYNGKEVSSNSFSSVSVIESFLLRLICILKLKKAPLILLDETFPAVDTGYIENTSKLIGQLCKKLKIDLLAVTHIAGLSESANISFRLTPKILLEKIKSK